MFKCANFSNSVGYVTIFCSFWLQRSLLTAKFCAFAGGYQICIMGVVSFSVPLEQRN